LFDVFFSPTRADAMLARAARAVRGAASAPPALAALRVAGYATAPTLALVGLHAASSAALCQSTPTMAAELVDEGDWNKTISAALPAVVSIKVNRVRSFDTASAGTIQATGFVVDAERGLILTNRHVAGPGPVVAEAVFQNNEEVPLSLAYYDPVHDFAFFRFDPAALRHMRPVALDLAPDQAEMTSEVSHY
jgi:S1-C subfamily serine protease